MTRYNVDNAGDVVTEAAGQGTDTVLATVSYTLAAGSEIEILQSQSAAGLTLTGNEFNNSDHRWRRRRHAGRRGGQRHTDRQWRQRQPGGGLGNDALNGGAGADTMAGGAGNDTYTVDNAGDVVTEATRRGHRHGAHDRQLHPRCGFRGRDPAGERRSHTA